MNKKVKKQYVNFTNQYTACSKPTILILLSGDRTLYW